MRRALAPGHAVMGAPLADHERLQIEANLARAELQEALIFLAPRMPNLALGGEPECGTIDGIYRLDSLPVRWG